MAVCGLDRIKRKKQIDLSGFAKKNAMILEYKKLLFNLWLQITENSHRGRIELSPWQASYTRVGLFFPTFLTMVMILFIQCVYSILNRIEQVN